MSFASFGRLLCRTLVVSVYSFTKYTVITSSDVVLIVHLSDIRLIP